MQEYLGRGGDAPFYPVYPEITQLTLTINEEVTKAIKKTSTLGFIDGDLDKMKSISHTRIG